MERRARPPARVSGAALGVPVQREAAPVAAAGTVASLPPESAARGEVAPIGRSNVGNRRCSTRSPTARASRACRTSRVARSSSPSSRRRERRLPTRRHAGLRLCARKGGDGGGVAGALRALPAAPRDAEARPGARRRAHGAQAVGPADARVPRGLPRQVRSRADEGRPRGHAAAHRPARRRHAAGGRRGVAAAAAARLARRRPREQPLPVGRRDAPEDDPRRRDGRRGAAARGGARRRRRAAAAAARGAGGAAAAVEAAAVEAAAAAAARAAAAVEAKENKNARLT